MLYAILCDDQPGALQLRLDTREKHLEHLNSLGTQLKFAGPFLDGNEKPCGSLVVIETDTPEAAQAVAERDPYAKAGLFKSVTVRPWAWSVNNPDTAPHKS